MITQERLFSLLRYCPVSGNFTWLVSRNQKSKAGSIAGAFDKDGYVVIKIDGRLYKAHRLAWLYINGSFPSNQIDHINLIKSDNSYSNLREANYFENGMNRNKCKLNTSGFKNVFWHKAASKWAARGCYKGKRYWLGVYENINDAYNAYSAFAKKHHKEFYREQEV